MPQSDQLSAALEAAGIRTAVVEAILGIDAVLQSWRRRVFKREIGRQALTDLGLDLDLPQLDVLTAIAAPANEFGTDAAEETMVSTVAERLAIDPSRASRLVADMVEAGYARRAVSQADARRAIVVLTTKGERVVEASRLYKFLLLGDFLNAWSDSDLATFQRQLTNFSNWTEETAVGRSRYAGKIEALRQTLARPDGT